MKNFFYILILGILTAAADPFLVETKIQTDLENVLSRLIEKNLFVVQVNSEVGSITERRIYEGEIVTTPPSPKPITPEAPIIAPMPGFVPEPDLEAKQELPVGPPPPVTKQLYRMVDTPVLKSVHVHVSLDDALPANVVQQVKKVVGTYLSTNFPNKSQVTYFSVPMLKPKVIEEKKDEAAPVTPPVPPKPEKDEKDRDLELKRLEKEQEERRLFTYALMGAAGFLGLLFFLVLRQQAITRKMRPKKVVLRPPLREKEEERPAPPPPAPVAPPPPQPLYPPFYPAYPPFYMGDNPFLKPPKEEPKEEKEEELEEPPAKVEPPPDNLQDLRRSTINLFYNKSDPFNLYYRRLGKESQDELYSVVKGHAFDGLMDSLGLQKPIGMTQEPSNPVEVLQKNLADFDEFMKALDWQKRQFFGFLPYLTDEQLMTLVNHENPLTVCMMLRFLKPNKSAFILDALTPERRAEILGNLPAAQMIPFTEMTRIEREVRQAADMMPKQFYGSPKEDIEFWGNVISETANSDQLLKELEQTQPILAPSLKKFKFKLEDAAAIPDTILKKVLDDVDNEELGLALATCKQEVVDVFLEAMSVKRRDVLKAQLMSTKHAPKETTASARLVLTKRFREAIA